MTFVWSFILVTMLSYVTGAIANIPFTFMPGAVLSVIAALVIIIIGEALPEEAVSDH